MIVVFAKMKNLNLNDFIKKNLNINIEQNKNIVTQATSLLSGEFPVSVQPQTCEHLLGCKRK